ncbi:hypothetical protein CAPTEDRAFT_186266 [Capitella teleta]|uniref:Uncharacterized protein n=1 Tax=Capitella teleta TaxID=283909 RepID=R7V8T2_CAPTE|nr:hypothetical protein CAPTEDRAFT_186266 [Capitella teleta]|eukprot:ELU14979.1 hypothetical protein CAPTEDRAFT_186266 [Capitella teleta]
MPLVVIVTRQGIFYSQKALCVAHAGLKSEIVEALLWAKGAVQNTEDVPDRVLRGCSTATLLGDADARRPSLPHLFSKLSYYNEALANININKTLEELRHEENIVNLRFTTNGRTLQDTMYSAFDGQFIGNGTETEQGLGANCEKSWFTGNAKGLFLSELPAKESWDVWPQNPRFPVIDNS